MKIRLDVFLTERGDFPSRQKAQAAIMAGLVYMDGQIADKAGTQVTGDEEIEVRGSDCPYVSRGGFKLEKALDVFGIDVSGMSCLDIGASTGGFTDCMLQRGAARVYAVDVGTNQLDWKLRSDPRVVCMEKTNFRYADGSLIPERVYFACTDVSFISLKHILPPAWLLLRDGGGMVCLIKPQFEAGREQVGKNGIVRDPAVHLEVILRVFGYAAENGFTVKDLSYSPVKGGKGNIEFLAFLEKEPGEAGSLEEAPEGGSPRSGADEAAGARGCADASNLSLEDMARKAVSEAHAALDERQA